MGRGNTYLIGLYEQTLYIDNDFIPDLECYEELKEFLTDKFTTRFSSFYSVDVYERNKHYIIENSLYQISLEDNEWSIAIHLGMQDAPELLGFQKKHFEEYCNYLKELLLAEYGEYGYPTGSWTHGVTVA